MRRLMKMYLSMAIAIVMVLGNCSFAALNNLAAKSTYLQLEKKNFEAMEELISKSEVLFDTNYNSAKGEMEIYGENLPGDLGNLKLKSVEEIDKEKSYQYGKITLGTKDTEKVSLEMILKDNVFMVQVPELYEKYISLDFSKLKEICEKFDIEATDEEINEFMNIISNAQKGSILSKEDEEYLNKQLPNYIKKLNNLVDSKYFSINNNSKISYNDKSLNCKLVTFEINMEELFNIFSKLCEELKNDEKLLDIFVYVMNYSGANKITSDEIVNSIDEFIVTANKNREELKEFRIISTLYYNSKKETLKREIKLAMPSMYKEESFSLTTINGSKNAYYELNYDDTKIIDNVVKTSKKAEHNISLISKGIDYDYDDETFEFKEIPYTKTENYKVLVETPDKKNTIITLSKEGETEKIVVEICVATSTNKKLDCNLKFTIDTKEVDYKVIINYLLEKDVKVIQKTFENAEISIDKMSKEELMKEVNDNKEVVNKKAEELAKELFPETIRMVQKSAVRSRESMIVQAIRIWKIETETDPTYSVNDRLSGTWREYSSLEGIGDYISLNYEPYYLDGGKYYVCENSSGKIIIGVSNNGGTDLPSPDSIVEADYDRTESGKIVYIESSSIKII